MRSGTTFSSGGRRGRRAARSSWSLVVGVLIALSFGAPVTATPLTAVVVDAGSGRGVSASFVAQARALLVQQLWQSRRVTVVDAAGPPAAWPAPPDALAALARSTNVSVAVAFDLARPGPQAPVSFAITCVDATGAARCDLRDDFWTMPADLPLVMQALGARLAETVAPRETARSSGESSARLPRATRFGLKSHLVVPLATSGLARQNLGGLSLFGFYDGRSHLIDVSAEYVAGLNDWHIAGLGASVLAPVGPGPAFPYLGAGLFAVSQQLGGQGAAGLQARPTLGLLVGRDALIRWRFEVSYVLDLFTEKGKDRLFPGSDRSFRMHGFVFTMGAAL